MPARRRLGVPAPFPVFVQQYARKAQRGVEPNDCRYDRKVARKLSQLKPTAMDALLRDDEFGDD
jgi:hypothetical protein